MHNVGSLAFACGKPICKPFCNPMALLPVQRGALPNHHRAFQELKCPLGQKWVVIWCFEC